jgi:hypothetical protein
MPSPVGHGLAALAVHALAARSRGELLDVRRAGLLVAAALAPDADLLFKLVDGRNHHQMETHGIGCAVLAGLAVWGLGRGLRWPEAGRLGLLSGLAWASHIALDYLGRDTHPPIGLMALWPLSSGFYKFPWAVFMDIGRTITWETVGHNLVAVAWETLLLLPLVLLSAALRRRAR